MTCKTHQTASGDHTVCRTCGETWATGWPTACEKARDLLAKASGHAPDNLPPPDADFRPRWPGDPGGYTADTVRRLIAEAVAQERARAERAEEAHPMTDNLPPPDAYIPDWVPARIQRYGHVTGHITKNVNEAADRHIPILYADTARRLLDEARAQERERAEKAEAERDALRAAWLAACAFIDCHAADPDITSKMVLAYAEFQRMRVALAARSKT